MLTTQRCLFDSPNKGHLPPLSLFELSFIATFSIIQLRSLLWNRVHGSFCSEACTKNNCIPFFFFYGRQGEERLPAIQNPLHHSAGYLFIYPTDAIFGLQNPRSGKMHQATHCIYLCWIDADVWGQARGWRMGNWSSANECQGNLDIHNCFSRVGLGESIRQKLCVIWEYISPLRLRHCCLLRQTRCALLDCTG